MTALAVLLSLAALGAFPASPAAPAPSVPCREAIDRTPFPYTGGGYRVVAGAVAVPPAYLPEIEDTGQAPWRYWRKAGLVVRAGVSVTLTVPKAWRTRFGIAWGNAERGTRSVVRIAACPGKAGSANVWAGGFVLRVPSACAPLVVRAGGRSATVWFGLGRRCRR